MTKVWVAVLLLMMSTVAYAKVDDDEEPAPKKGKKQAPPPDEEETATAAVDAGDLVAAGSPKARMTLPGGKFMLNAIVEANLAKKLAGKPLSVAPDLWIGVTDRLTFGIYHSGRAATGFLSGFGTGLCFRGGETGICKVTGLGDVYTFVGSEARIGLTEGGFATALVLGAQVRGFEPKRVISGKAGFLVRLNSKRVAVEISPMAFIGITQRKVGGMDFNRDEIAVPVTLFLRFAPRFSLALQAGITSTLKKFGDNYEVPAAAGLAWWVSPHFSIDAAFGLAAIADKNDMTKAFDQRSVTVGLGYAL
jgi:hypothetical protein